MESIHNRPILVTGAAGAIGAIGRNLTAMLLAKGHKVARPGPAGGRARRRPASFKVGKARNEHIFSARAPVTDMYGGNLVSIRVSNAKRGCARCVSRKQPRTGIASLVEAKPPAP